MSKHRGAPRRIMRGRSTHFGPLVAIMAALALLFGMLGISAPAQATGNNGTIKIHEEGTPVGTESNDPKVCSFNIESYNLDAGQTGYIVFDVQGGDGPTGTPAGPFDFGPADETGFFATEYYSLDNGHYKATLYGKFGNGSINYEDVKAKSKVFKVDCPPPAEPEGSNNSSSAVCEQITVGTPTGVKPEGATVVVKLNGAVTQPGTYAVAPGEYTVTTYVNGTLVDTDVVTVTKCEDEVEPEGNLTVNSICESITFSSNGVKPEDAVQVFKLDGVVKAPGTYPVTAGSHTVELFVNGENVDSETITVAKCEEPGDTVTVPVQETVDPCNPEGVTNNVAWKSASPVDSDKVDWSESNNGATRTATLKDSDDKWSDGTKEPKVFNLPADSGAKCPVTPPPPVDVCPEPGTQPPGTICVTPPPPPTPNPEPKKVRGAAKMVDKCRTAGDLFAVRKQRGVVYFADGERIREGVWLRTGGDRKVVIKAKAASKKFDLVGKSRWVFRFDNRPCGNPEEPPPTGARLVA